MTSLMTSRRYHCVWLGMLAGACLLATERPAPAAEADDGVAARLAAMPRPWTGPKPRLVREEYEETLRYWAEKHPKLVKLEKRGQSAEGLPVFLLRITDSAIPEADKQHCLVTAMHSGNERSGATTVLRLAEWLLGDDAEAAEARRKQVLLLMPIVNPYGLFVREGPANSQGVDPYAAGRGKLWDIQALKLREPEKAPELVAFLGVVDQYRPEVHVDCHGVTQRFAGQTMLEVTGSSYSNFTLRPWDWRITEAMVDAARAAGYGAERFEADAQRCFWGPDIDVLSDRLWLGRTFFYSAHYGYAKYHTMITALEIGWEESGLARLRGLLRVGNRVWDGESRPGYPVDRTKYFLSHFVTAYGTIADVRRQSRVELWRQQPALAPAMLYPQTDGRDTFFVAVGRKAAALLAEKPAEFLERLRDRADVAHAPLAAFLAAGPEDKVVFDPFKAADLPDDARIEHGLALRLRLPYRKPELVDLRLNGRALPRSATDGYETWYGDGHTQVQVNVPPEKSRQGDLWLVTCAYRPDVARTTGWRAPAEVVRRVAQPPSAVSDGQAQPRAAVPPSGKGPSR